MKQPLIIASSVSLITLAIYSFYGFYMIAHPVQSLSLMQTVNWYIEAADAIITNNSSMHTISILFFEEIAIWIITYFIAKLYEKQIK